MPGTGQMAASKFAQTDAEERVKTFEIKIAEKMQLNKAAAKISKDNLKGENDHLKVFDCIKFNEKNISTAWRKKKATNLISNNIEKIVSSCVHLLTVYETK